MPSQPHQHLSSIPLQLHLTEEEWYQRVSRKAYELYQLRGEEPGHDLDAWLAAERLARKTLCFSRSDLIHDIVIGLSMNYVEFGCVV